MTVNSNTHYKAYTCIKRQLLYDDGQKWVCIAIVCWLNETTYGATTTTTTSTTTAAAAAAVILLAIPLNSTQKWAK